MPDGNDSRQHGFHSYGDRPERALTVRLSEIAPTLQGEVSLNATLQAIVRSAVSNVDGADYTGITLVTGDGKVSTPTATDNLIMQIDRIQYETQQGPCLSAIRQDATVWSN